MRPTERGPSPRAAEPIPLLLLEERAGELAAARDQLTAAGEGRFAMSVRSWSSWVGSADPGPESGAILIGLAGLRKQDALHRIGTLRVHAEAALVALCEWRDLALLSRLLDAGADAVVSVSELTSAALQDSIVTAIHGRDQRRRLERERDRAVHLNEHDRITNLENRHALERRLKSMLASAGRKQGKLGVLLVATGGIESVSDSLGREGGDQLLRALADRLLASVRLGDEVSLQEDGGEAAVSHLGGNEFTVMLTEIRTAQDAARVAQRIIEALGRAFRVRGEDVFVQTSVGIAVFPSDGSNAEVLLRNARSARLRAEEDGGNRFLFYAPTMNSEAARRLKIGSLLHRALDRGEFALHYQPLRHAVDGSLLAVEALLRWSPPEMGPISPAEFIPIAEETNLIVSIGEWVLHAAASQHRRWCEQGYAPIRLAVNLSGRQLEGGQLVRSVTRILADTGMSANDLELEITETTIAREHGVARDVLEGLHEMGVGLALDDFGTGFSTLTHLTSFPVDRLKIDRSFTSQIAPGGEGRDAAGSLASALIAMGHSLELAVVAEGVETVEQARFLREHGCDELQGFLLGRPMPADEFERFLVPAKTR
jgi:diguanylate cyclase (GGDEF)-like protein